MTSHRCIDSRRSNIKRLYTIYCKRLFIQRDKYRCHYFVRYKDKTAHNDSARRHKNSFIILIFCLFVRISFNLCCFFVILFICMLNKF